MFNWINTHGLEAIAIYFVFCIVCGSVPPLPAEAGFLATWLYLIVKAASANSRGIGKALGIATPEIQLANIPGLKSKTDITPKE
jgi:hypothetical protein